MKWHIGWLALRQLIRAWHAGEIRVLLCAMTLAVGAMSAVGLFADRIQSALTRQGNQLLGGDLAWVADHPVPPTHLRQAAAMGLAVVQTREFPSMVAHGDQAMLAEIKAVGETYPLRGEIMLSAHLFGPAYPASGAPAPGTVWIEPRLAQQLQVGVGASIAVGTLSLRVTAILRQEPARSGDLFALAPRLLMHERDLAASGLEQPGARIAYRLLVAGTPEQVARFDAWARPRLMRGERLEDVAGARPEIRDALEKSRRFLGLAAMASVILAMVAMGLAGIRFVQRNLDACALMRCFGASQNFILRLFLTQALWLGLIGSLLGGLLGYGAQAVLAWLVGHLFLQTLPAPAPDALAIAALGGMAALLCVMLPHLLKLRGVPALRILRHASDTPVGGGRLAWLPALAVLLGLVFWSAGDARLGAMVVAGLLGLLLLAGLGVGLAGWLLRRVLPHARGIGRVALATLLHRPGLVVAQVAGFSLGLTAMALLTIVRSDLLERWQAALPADAPNRFVINIQPQQLSELRDFFADEGLPLPEILPMVRGRLVAINGMPLDTTRYTDPRARRLAEREFNLSWSAVLQADNRTTAGHWWTPAQYGQPLLSLEQGLADTLGIQLGDRLTYLIAGDALELQVAHLREVDWDSMRPNFFAITPPGVLADYPATYISSFHLPPGREIVLSRLVKRMPNLTVIDVAALMAQVRGIMDRMTLAVECVFGFCLLTGIAVLYAAILATSDQRRHEAAMLRLIGASRRQVGRAVLLEFTGIALLSGTVAAIAAGSMGWSISSGLLHLPYQFNPMIALLTCGLALVLIPGAAWWGLRHTLEQPPRAVLQSV